MSDFPILHDQLQCFPRLKVSGGARCVRGSLPGERVELEGGMEVILPGNAAPAL
jgi:hypothetical protein